MAVAVGVDVGTAVFVAVGVPVGVLLAVGELVGVGVWLGVGVAELVGDGVAVGVALAVGEGVRLAVGVAETDGVTLGVDVGDGDGVLLAVAVLVGVADVVGNGGTVGVVVAVTVAVGVLVPVGDGVTVAVAGTIRRRGKNSRWPACRLVVSRQFALRIAGMVVPCRSANINIVSPRRTVYRSQLSGGPQATTGGLGVAWVGRKSASWLTRLPGSRQLASLIFSSEML